MLPDTCTEPRREREREPHPGTFRLRRRPPAHSAHPNPPAVVGANPDAGAGVGTEERPAQARARAPLGDLGVNASAPRRTGARSLSLKEEMRAAAATAHRDVRRPPMPRPQQPQALRRQLQAPPGEAETPRARLLPRSHRAADPRDTPRSPHPAHPPVCPPTGSTIRHLRVAFQDTPPQLKELEEGWWRERRAARLEAAEEATRARLDSPRERLQERQHEEGEAMTESGQMENGDERPGRAERVEVGSGRQMSDRAVAGRSDRLAVIRPWADREARGRGNTPPQVDRGPQRASRAPARPFSALKRPAQTKQREEPLHRAQPAQSRQPQHPPPSSRAHPPPTKRRQASEAAPSRSVSFFPPTPPSSPPTPGPVPRSSPSATTVAGATSATTARREAGPSSVSGDAVLLLAPVAPMAAVAAAPTPAEEELSLPRTTERSRRRGPRPITSHPLPQTLRPQSLGKPAAGDTVAVHGPAGRLAITLSLQGGSTAVALHPSGALATIRTRGAGGAPARTTALALADAAQWTDRERRFWTQLAHLVDEFKRETPHIYTPLGELVVTCSSPPDIVLSFALPERAAGQADLSAGRPATPDAGFSSRGTISTAATAADLDPDSDPAAGTRVRLRYSACRQQLALDTARSGAGTAPDKFKTRRHAPLVWRDADASGSSSGVSRGPAALGIAVGPDWTAVEREAARRLWDLRVEWGRFVTA